MSENSYHSESRDALKGVMKADNSFFREITKKLVNFEKPTKGAIDFAKNARQKENIKFFQITALLMNFL